MKKWKLNFKLAAVLILMLIVLTSCSQVNNSVSNNMVQSRKTSEAKPIDRTVSGLSESKQSEIVELNDKQILQLKAMPVVKEINGVKIKMYGYNGQIPGPLIKVRQGSTIYVNFTNNIELDSKVHWQGIGLENKNNGV